MQLTGNAQWNELEGGFWSLHLDQHVDEIGEHVVLIDVPKDAPLEDGARLTVTGELDRDGLDFLMAGTRFLVTRVERTEPG